MSVWNSHRIRPSINENVPHGRPVVVYYIFATRNYMKVMVQRNVDICISPGEYICDQDMFVELLLTYMVQGLTPLTNAREGVDLYYTLRPFVLQDLFV